MDVDLRPPILTPPPKLGHYLALRQDHNGRTWDRTFWDGAVWYYYGGTVLGWLPLPDTRLPDEDAAPLQDWSKEQEPPSSCRDCQFLRPTHKVNTVPFLCSWCGLGLTTENLQNPPLFCPWKKQQERKEARTLDPRFCDSCRGCDGEGEHRE